MALLKSVSNVPGIDFYDYRDSQYYNKYEYRARFNLRGIRYTWYVKNHAELDHKINNSKGYYGIRKEDKEIVNDNLSALKAFITWRNDRKTDKLAMIRIEGNTIAAFSNDLNLLKTLENIDSKVVVDYTQVQCNAFIGVKSFVAEPKHNYRVYLKSKRVTTEFAKDLHELLSRSKDLYPSDALRYWLVNSQNYSHPSYSWRYRWSSASHFIDYDDVSTISYLLLIHGDMMGKRYKLEKRAEPI